MLTDATGRIEDLTLDGLGRLHAVVFAPHQSGVLVRTPAGFCQTVNAFDPAYPLRTPSGQPSPGTRAVAAGAEAIWVHGSDAGIARVIDSLRTGPCPTAGVAVQYDLVLRREDGELPANTVPAVLVGRAGALWVGSALGLSRLRDGQVTRVPFAPELSFRGNPGTLEAFFQAVAQATKVFLVPVAGNNQRAQPGEVLPEPLVVRLEDQFGKPVVGEAVAVRITRGEGTVVAADAATNAQGEARVRVQAGASDIDLVVAVVAPALPEVRPAQFFAVIGAFDTPGDALDLVVAGDVVFIADVSNGGLQVLDVQDPPAPGVYIHC
ncbi:MAG TPA: hypothetical protein VI542_01275 [Candidatus Tectomicrobia bacterium]